MTMHVSTTRLCGAAVVTRDDGKVLMLRRAAADTSPGKWELPGGSFEFEDQHTAITARRETLEEAGLHVQIGPQISRTKFKHPTKPDVELEFAIYSATILDKNELVILSADHDEYRWVHLIDLPRMDLVNGLLPAIYEITLKLRADKHNTNILEIFEMAMVERAHAVAKWGNKPRTPAEWALILEEEVDECKSAYTKTENNEKVLKETMQVFATALGCLMEHGWRLRDNLHPNTIAKMKELGFDNVVGDFLRMANGTDHQ